MRTRSLPVIKVHGGPYERGFQHGSQAGDLIRRYADVLLQASALEGAWRGLKQADGPLGREALLKRALAFLPQMERFSPQLVEEVRGIADGAKVPFAEALLVNVRAEVLGVEGCTSFALGRGATADGSILAGQNLDQHPANEALQIILHVEPDEGPALLMCSFAGLVGYAGLNSAGVAFFQNALSTSLWRADGIPHYFLKRVLLEQTAREGCLAAMRLAPVCSSGNYVLADQNGILDVELAPDGYATLRPLDDVVVHTNHFLSARYAPQDVLLPGMPDSADRLARLRALIEPERGRLTVAKMQAMLADHDNHPTSICRHQDGFVTIASMVAEPDQGRLHVAVGNPCENGYVTYSL